MNKDEGHVLFSQCLKSNYKCVLFGNESILFVISSWIFLKMNSPMSEQPLLLLPTVNILLFLPPNISFWNQTRQMCWPPYWSVKLKLFYLCNSVIDWYETEALWCAAILLYSALQFDNLPCEPGYVKFLSVRPLDAMLSVCKIFFFIWRAIEDDCDHTISLNQCGDGTILVRDWESTVCFKLQVLVHAIGTSRYCEPSSTSQLQWPLNQP